MMVNMLRTLLSRSAATLALAFVLTAGVLDAQANARWYIGTYTHDILVWDEQSEEIVDRIQTRNFIPTGILPNQSRTRLYIQEASAERIEIVDIERGEVTDEFTLSHDSVKVRISGFAPHPSDERAVLFVK